jgi:hypothetical protein
MVIKMGIYVMDTIYVRENAIILGNAKENVKNFANWNMDMKIFVIVK